METKEIMALIAETFAKGAASTIVTIKSADSKMNKGRGENRNPFIGHVTIKTTYTGFVMGTDYSSSLERTAARMGNEESEVRLKESWHKPASVLKKIRDFGGSIRQISRITGISESRIRRAE